MAKRKAGRGAKRAKTRARSKASGKRQSARARNRPAKRARAKSSARKAVRRPAAGRKRAVAKRRIAKPAPKPVPTVPKAAAKKKVQAAAPPSKVPRLDRARRTLAEGFPSVPSSLDLDRHGSAARTGRHEMNENLADHATMGPRAITGGDVDANIEQAYFSGDEAPGGDNPTPDQDLVDDIGKALGVEYQDNEELRGADKVAGRDKKRWELDPASAEDYKER